MLTGRRSRRHRRRRGAGRRRRLGRATPTASTPIAAAAPSLRHVVVDRSPTTASCRSRRRRGPTSPSAPEAAVAATAARRPGVLAVQLRARPACRRASCTATATCRRPSTPTHRRCCEIGPDDRCLSVAKLFFAYGLGQLADVPVRRRRDRAPRTAATDAARSCSNSSRPSSRRCSSPARVSSPHCSTPTRPTSVRIGAGDGHRRRGAARRSAAAVQPNVSAIRCSTASARPRRCTSSCPTRSTANEPGPADAPSPATTTRLCDDDGSGRHRSRHRPGTSTCAVPRSRPATGAARRQRPRRSMTAGCAPATCTHAPPTTTGRSSGATAT